MSFWWTPLFFSIGMGLLFTLILAMRYTPLRPIGKFLDEPFFLLFLLSFAANFICGILHLCRKQIKRGIAVLISNLICLLFCIAGAGILILWLAVNSPDDHFADNLKLPENIVLTEPLPCTGQPPTGNMPPLPDAATGKAGMTLYNDFQGGLYIFNILCNPKEAGMLNIRGRELTTQTALKLTHPKQHIRSSSTAEDLIPCQIPFIIHNGNCGQYYGAELELWFTPDSGKSPRKLFSGNYRVQGWLK